MYYNINNFNRLAAVKADIKTENSGIKQELSDEYRDMERMFQPVVGPLRQLANSQASISKLEILAIEQPPNVPAIEQPPIIPAIEGSSNEVMNLGILAVSNLKKLNLQDYDHTYGIRPFEGSSKFRLGRMDVTIDGNDFIIDDKKYIGTENLWKLLTFKNPGKPSDGDLETYREILLKTKPFLQEHTDRVKCNRGLKYRTLVKPIADQWKSTP